MKFNSSSVTAATAAVASADAATVAQMSSELDTVRARVGELDPTDVASAAQVKLLQAELQHTTAALNAVFSTSFGNNGDQVQAAVATKEGATLRVVNPQAEQRLDAIGVEVGANQEQIADLYMLVEQQQQQLQELLRQQQSK
jgi:hypothetical protein